MSTQTLPARPATPLEPVPRENLAHFPRFDGNHPTRWTFPDYLNNPACRWLQCLREMYEMPIIFPASVSPEAGLMLHSLIRNLRPRVVVEVGTFLSVSTHWIAAAMREYGGGIIHCFDDFGPVHKGPWRDAEMLSGRLEWVQERLTKAGLIDLVRFHPGDSPTQLGAAHEELRAAGGVDFAYIDGDHTVRGMCADFWATEPVLNTGGYMMVHDVYPEQCGGHEGPRHVLDHLNIWRFLKRLRTGGPHGARHLMDNHETIGAGLYEKVELYLSPLNYGMGLLRRIG